MTWQRPCRGKAKRQRTRGDFEMPSTRARHAIESTASDFTDNADVNTYRCPVPKAKRCAGSGPCQNSSGVKDVRTTRALRVRNATRKARSLAPSTAVYLSTAHMLTAVVDQRSSCRVRCIGTPRTSKTWYFSFPAMVVHKYMWAFLNRGGFGSLDTSPDHGGTTAHHRDRSRRQLCAKGFNRLYARVFRPPLRTCLALSPTVSCCHRFDQQKSKGFLTHPKCGLPPAPTSFRFQLQERVCWIE